MKKILASIITVFALVLGAGIAMAVPVVAEGENLCEDFKDRPELAEAAGCNTTTKADTFINNLITVVLSFMGVVAVGVIIYGGYIYMMSAGDAARVYQGRNIILYGVVGLVVTLVAYAIVYFISQVLA